MQFGFQLPAVVRESYLEVDGQEAESASGYSEGLFFGLTLLPLEDVLDEWRLWREVDEDANTGANPRLLEAMRSLPDQWVRHEYSCRGWLPLATDRAGNYLGVDVDPGKNGVAGQVIVFGRDFDTKVVLWRGDGEYGWARWLASFAEELESGEGFEIGDQGDTGSEHSVDSIGYEGYFYDGAAGSRGEGGADGGTGGMRLTGEYKGWNILEAWADRSVRRWQEAGIIPNDAAPAPPEVRVDNTLKSLASGIMGGSAEVAIPVLTQPVDGSALEPSTTSKTKVSPNIAVTISPPPQSPSIHSPKPAPLTPTGILTVDVTPADNSQSSSTTETSSVEDNLEDSPTQASLPAPVSPETVGSVNVTDLIATNGSPTIRLVEKGAQDPKMNSNSSSVLMDGS
jgi:cell wall assembly regulator SMI1